MTALNRCTLTDSLWTQEQVYRLPLLLELRGDPAPQLSKEANSRFIDIIIILLLLLTVKIYVGPCYSTPELSSDSDQTSQLYDSDHDIALNVNYCNLSWSSLLQAIPPYQIFGYAPVWGLDALDSMLPPSSPRGSLNNIGRNDDTFDLLPGCFVLRGRPAAGYAPSGACRRRRSLQGLLFRRDAWVTVRRDLYGIRVSGSRPRPGLPVPDSGRTSVPCRLSIWPRYSKSAICHRVLRP